MAATSGLLLWANGEWTAAAQIARQTIADHGSRRSVVTARWAVGYVALGRGALAAAESELGAALAVGEESGTIDLILPPLWGLAEAALLADQPDRAAEHCRRALKSARAIGEWALLVPFVVTGVRAEQAAGRPSGAAAWLDACARHLDPLAAVASRRWTTLEDWSRWRLDRPLSREWHWTRRSRHGRTAGASGKRHGRDSTSPNAWAVSTASPIRWP